MTAFPDRGGLQPERTSLAWSRTGIGATVCLVPMLVTAVRHGHWVLAGVLAVATVPACLVTLSLRHRQGQLRDDDTTLPDVRPIAALAGVVVVGAFGGLVTALVMVLG